MGVGGRERFYYREESIGFVVNFFCLLWRLVFLEFNFFVESFVGFGWYGFFRGVIEKGFFIFDIKRVEGIK